MSTELPKDCPVPSTDAEDQSLRESGEILLAAKFESVMPQSMSSSLNDDVQIGEQVLGYLEVQPSDLGVDQENATIFLQPQEIEIDGQHVILTQEGEGGNEIIVVVTNPDSPLWDAEPDNLNSTKCAASPHTQSTVINSSAASADNSDRTHTLCVSQHIELIGNNLVESSADSVEPVGSESEGLQCSSVLKTDSTEISSSSWNIPTSKLQENEDSTEMLFIPTPSVLSSNGGLTTSLVLSTSEVETKHRSLMQLACIAQKLQSSNDKTSERSEPHSSENCHNTRISDLHSTDNDELRIKPQDQDISSSSYIMTEVTGSLQENQEISISACVSADTAVTSSSNNVCLSSSAITNKLLSDQSLPALSSDSPDICSQTADQTSSNIEVTSSSPYSLAREMNLTMPKTTEHLNASKNITISSVGSSEIDNEQSKVTKEQASDVTNSDTCAIHKRGTDSFKKNTETEHILSSLNMSSSLAITEDVFLVQKDADVSGTDSYQSDTALQSLQTETLLGDSILPSKDVRKPHILTITNVNFKKSPELEESSLSHICLSNDERNASITDDSGVIESHLLTSESDHCRTSVAACGSSNLSSAEENVEDQADVPEGVCNGSSESINDVEMNEDSSIYLEKIAIPSVGTSDLVHSTLEVQPELVHDSLEEVQPELVHDTLEEDQPKLVHDALEVQPELVHDTLEGQPELVCDTLEVQPELVHDTLEEGQPELVHDTLEGQPELVQDTLEDQLELVQDTIEVRPALEHDTHEEGLSELVHDTLEGGQPELAHDTLGVQPELVHDTLEGQPELGHDTLEEVQPKLVHDALEVQPELVHDNTLEVQPELVHDTLEVQPELVHNALEVHCENSSGDLMRETPTSNVRVSEEQRIHSNTSSYDVSGKDKELFEDRIIAENSLSPFSTMEIPASPEGIDTQASSKNSLQKQSKLAEETQVHLKTSVTSSVDEEVLKRKLDEYDFEDDSVNHEITTFEGERCSKKPRLISTSKEQEVQMTEKSPKDEDEEKCFSSKAAKYGSSTDTAKNASPTIIRISVDCPQENTDPVTSDFLSSPVLKPLSEDTQAEFAENNSLHVAMDIDEIDEREENFTEKTESTNEKTVENLILVPSKEVQQDSSIVCEGFDGHDAIYAPKSEALVGKNHDLDIEIIESQIEPPKKTYTRHSKPNDGPEKNESASRDEAMEIELFSCDGLGETSQSDLDPSGSFQSGENVSDTRTQPNGDMVDDELLSSGIEKRVTTTYKGVKGLIEKKKTWSFRARVSSLKSVKDTGTPLKQKKRANESTPSKSVKKTKHEDKSNTELSAYTSQAEAPSTVESPVIKQSPSAGVGTSSGDETVIKDTAVTPTKRSKTKSLKSKPSSVVLWEKLVKSPPGKVKRSKFLSSIKRKQVKSPGFKVKPVPSYSFCFLTKSHKVKHKRTLSEPSITANTANEVNASLTPLKPIDIRIRCQPSTSSPDKTNIYQCGNCKFKCNRLENLIQHYKARCLREGSDIFELGINDMDRRQRIRGEDVSDTSDSRTYHSMYGLSRSFYSDDNGFLKPSEEYSDNDTDDDEAHTNVDDPADSFGFKEGDIVWAEWKDIFWPSLVRRIYPKEKKVFVFLVGIPLEKNSMKISVGKIQPFDNAKLTKKLLGEGGGFPNKEVFVKAVQKAEEFIRKKLLGMSVNPSQFFENLNDSNADMSDVESSVSSQSEKANEKHTLQSVDDDSVQQNSLSSAHVATDADCDGNNADSSFETAQERPEVVEEKLQKYVKCIKDGNVDEHLLGILDGSVQSKRHQRFHSSSASNEDVLKNETWFGPICSEKEQLDISDYCMHLLKSKCADKGTFDRISYIFEVWVPEAIIKAISLVETVPLEEAEELFIKDSTEKAKLHLDVTSTSEENHKEKLLLRMRDAFVAEEITQALSE